MNPDKLKKLQQNVRIGGKGTPRRKHKVQHKTTGGDDKKLQFTLKRLGVQPIQGIDEVNLFRDDGKIIHFTGNNLKVQASIQANTYVVAGTAEEKTLESLMPGILSQMGGGGPNFDFGRLAALKNAMASNAAGAGADDEDVPSLVENFDSKPAAGDAAAEKK